MAGTPGGLKAEVLERSPGLDAAASPCQDDRLNSSALLGVSLLSFLLVHLTGDPAGPIAGVKRNSLFDRVAMMLALAARQESEVGMTPESCLPQRLGQILVDIRGVQR